MKRWILAFIIGLLLAAVAQAQTREPFKPIEEGFSVSRAVEKDGSHSLLVLFPDEYVKDDKAFRVGTDKVLILIFTCEVFTDCKPVSETKFTKDGTTYLTYKTVVPGFTLAVFGLGETTPDAKKIGLLIQLYRPEKQIIMEDKLIR